MNTIGERLEYAIDKKGTKKGTVARAIKSHATTIDNYIKGKVSTPDPRILDDIAEHLDISIEWLTNGTGTYEDSYVRNGTANESLMDYEKDTIEIDGKTLSTEQFAVAAINNDKKLMLNKVYNTYIEEKVSKRVLEIFASGDNLKKYLND